MPDYGREKPGKTPADTINVAVETNIDVVKALEVVRDGVAEVKEEQKNTQLVLEFILGEEVDTEEE